MEQFEKINKLGKSLKGNILVIGFQDDSKLVKDLNESKLTNKVFTLNSNGGSLIKKRSKRKKLNGVKSINIRKLKKELKNEKFDYIIADFETILPFFSSFVKNSILVADEGIYIAYDSEEYSHEEIIKRYERYNCKVKKEKEKNNYLFSITTNDIKRTFLKSIGYWFRDFGYDLAEAIANILIG